MEIANSFIKLLGAYLEHSTLKEKNKYKDRFLKLRKQYIEEISKPPHLISTNDIDHILNDMCDLSKIITTSKT